MFEGLDDIGWASLQHAYGSAEDVPGWIRGLIDPDPAVREESLDAMYGSVHHQGDVYDSTVAAVPFLIEALAAPDLPGRAEIASLLASIARPYKWPDGMELDDHRIEIRRQKARANPLATWGPIAAPATETIARHLAALAAQPWRDGLPEWIVRHSDGGTDLSLYRDPRRVQ